MFSASFGNNNAHLHPCAKFEFYSFTHFGDMFQRNIIGIFVCTVYLCTVGAAGDIVPSSNKDPFRLELRIILILIILVGHRLLNRLTRLRQQWNVYRKQMATIVSELLGK